jgi:RND family efflux transporter MFP subunit
MLKINVKISSMLLCSLLIFSGCTEDKQEKQEKVVAVKPKALLPVEFIDAKKQKVPIWMRFNGTTKASNKQTVQVRVKGRLKKVFFEAGQLVKKGETLFEIERDTLESQVDASKARLQVDKVNLKLAEADLARYAPLARDGLIPKQKFEQQKTLVESFKAKVSMGKANLDEKRTNLGYSTIQAPISGVISRSLVDVGNLVGYDGPTQLTNIVVADPMYAYFTPSEEEIQIIRKYRDRKEMDAVVIIPTKNKKLLGDRRVRGTVDFSESLVDVKTSTISSRVVFKNPKLQVFPGTFVTVGLLVTDQMEIMAVPKSAIQRDQISQYVFVINNKDEIERKNIVTGYETKQFKVIREGLKDHDRVIMSNFIKVKPKMKVSPVDVTDKKGIIAIMKEKNLLDLRNEK